MSKEDSFERNCFEEESLRAILGACGHFPKIISYATIDSTNRVAKDMASICRDDVIVTADSQTAGRGRMGRQFYSPDRTGAYFSILHTVSSLQQAVTVTAAASVAVMRAIRSLTGKQTEIKWVNDLYYQGKKVCGILTESVPVDGGAGVVIGIGINLSTTDFPKELQQIAGSLETEETSAVRLIAQVYRELYPFLRDCGDRSWLEDYRAYSCVIGKRIRWGREGDWKEGKALEIDEDAALFTITDDGVTDRLFTGEISIKMQ